ncbi:hypothetical protein A2U01_0028936, partial [Trifolium medium]|nr:hypothetical protein [Trifolium medium]
HHVYDSPSHDADDYYDHVEHASGGNGPILFFMVFTVGMSIVSGNGNPLFGSPMAENFSPPKWDGRKSIAGCDEEKYSLKRRMRMSSILDGAEGCEKVPPLDFRPVDIPIFNY